MKYPKIQDREEVGKSNNSYNWGKGCCFCKKPFREDEKFIRVDVAYTYMRGDDEVFVFHKECEPKQHLLEKLK